MSFSLDTALPPRARPGRARALTLSAPLALVLACDAAPSSQATRAAHYDVPHPIPTGIPYEGEGHDDDGPSPAVTSAEDCPRGRGLDKDGACVVLTTREHEFGGMVQIPAGAFVRGDIPTRYDGKDARERAHVRMPGQPLFADQLPSFWMDGYEISREAYAKCVGEGKCSEVKCLDGSDGRPSQVDISDDALGAFPQTCVTHDQAKSYCEWRGHRLPTEAEWEFAARGPKGWMFPWGNELRDELGLALGPVGFDPLDVSYFGLRGFGGNAIEWVAESFEPDANLSRYLQGEFRSPEGPLAASWAAWTRDMCGGSDCELGTRYVIKGGRSGVRAGAWQFADAEGVPKLPSENFEGGRAIGQHERLGFRCAADLEPEQEILTIPEGPEKVPIVGRNGGYELMRAVAEAVDRAEAERFCQVLAAPSDPDELPEGGHGWRLPRLEEIQALYMFFPGPGPFWSADGAVERTFVDQKTAEWERVEASDDMGLMAACIRDAT